MSHFISISLVKCGAYNMKDIIYVLTNEAMPGLVKIGFTTTSVEQRIRELDGTGIPLSFECFYAAVVREGKWVEKKIHDLFRDVRVRFNREFFRVDPERVRTAISLAAVEDVTPQVDLALSKEDVQALEEHERRQPFRFSIAKVPANSILRFTRDENKTCRVINDKYVEFEGQTMSLSGAALCLLKEMGYRSQQVQGPLYWAYDGETLVERRPAPRKHRKC